VTLRALIFLRYVTLAGFGLVLADCQPITGCDPSCTASVTVRGQIRDVAGSPLPQATVALETFGDTCGVFPLILADVSAGNPVAPIPTDAAGQYAVHVFIPSAAGRYCTRITITPPAGRGESMTLQRDLEFGADNPRTSTSVAVIDAQLAR
jgi:hypothetical protein